jgi:hypothetical protein
VLAIDRKHYPEPYYSSPCLPILNYKTRLNCVPIYVLVFQMVSFHLVFPQNHLHLSLLSMCGVCPKHLFLLDSTSPIIFGEKYTDHKASHYVILSDLPVCSLHWTQTFSQFHILSSHFIGKIRKPFSNPYKRRGKANIL